MAGGRVDRRREHHGGGATGCSTGGGTLTQRADGVSVMRPQGAAQLVHEVCEFAAVATSVRQAQVELARWGLRHGAVDVVGEDGIVERLV